MHGMPFLVKGHHCSGIDYIIVNIADGGNVVGI